MEGEQGPRQRPTRIRDFSRIVKATREVSSIAWQGPGAIVRKLPWEKMPFISEALKPNIEKIGKSALNAFHTRLLEKAKAKDNIDRQKDADLYRELFGKDPSSVTPNESPVFENFRYITKGWNSLVFSFTTTPKPGKEPKKWVIKVGYKHSPDAEFYIHPSDPRHTAELQANMEILENAVQDPRFELPHLLPKPFAPEYLHFGDHKERAIGRSILVMPYQQILSLDQVRDFVKNDNHIAQDLGEELRRFSGLRKHLCKKEGLDVDFTGLDNVVVVNEPNEAGEPVLHIKLLDLGLRDHKKIALLAHGQFDILGFIHGLKLRRAILGRQGKDGIEDDKRAESEIIQTGQHMRFEIVREKRRDWVAEHFQGKKSKVAARTPVNS